MTKSDWINIICAVLSLLVAVIIAILQCKQASRMEKFEKRQDERDENRHNEVVKATAVSFLSKYYNDRRMIPLCAMAAMYNELYYYNRSMFREFCCYTTEIQNKILEYSKIDFRINDGNIFSKCIAELTAVVTADFKNDNNIFYEGGKYIQYGITKYGNRPIPFNNIEYKEYITDKLSCVYREENYDGTPIKSLCKEYGFEKCDEIEACQFAMVVAEYVAIYKGNMMNCYRDYEMPKDDDLKSMEDLFLKVLFEIYSNLVI